MTIYGLKQLIARGLGSAFNLDKQIIRCRDRYILCYHRIISAQEAGSDGVHPSLWLSPERFASQIQWMRSIGRIVDCSHIIDTTIPNDRPLFALTFDDGWKDNYERAFPILKLYKVPALMFLSTAAVESGELFWPHDIATKTKRLVARGGAERVLMTLREYLPNLTMTLSVMQIVERWIESLKPLNEYEREQRIGDYYHRLQLNVTPLTGYIMSWDEAREMQEHGIRFGSHTHRHTILKDLSPEKIESELRVSKELITDDLNIEVDSFCYPNGRYDYREAAFLSRCGYKYGYRIDNVSMNHCTDSYYIPRFMVSERNSANQSYFKMYLLQAPLYRSQPHQPRLGDR